MTTPSIRNSGNRCRRTGLSSLAPLLLIALAVALAACSGGSAAPNASIRLVTPIPTPTPTPPPPPALTVNDIFPPRDLASLHLDPTRVRTLIATGDVIPARTTDRAIRQQGNNYFYPLAPTADILRAADLTVINLEAPLMTGCPPVYEGFTFCGQAGFATALAQAGVDVATLENNHITNYGPQGVRETIGHLEANGIEWADRTTMAIEDVRGLKFGFLAFNGVGEVIGRDAMVAAIRQARPQVDVLTVAYHWGAEYVSVPDVAPGIADDWAPEIAHLAVDAGADLVIGNHPHWVQAVEFYKGKFIAYAHGNFIFDQMWSYETRVGVIGRYTFYDNKLIGIEFLPTLIEDYAQPNLLEGAERQAVLDGMLAASRELAKELTASGG
ncbi:MAG TPA: CapA family protein [Dehalococcoidia bacterium]|nr:CapA family protein [Dehalococcoidia bacterium]